MTLKKPKIRNLARVTSPPEDVKVKTEEEIPLKVKEKKANKKSKNKTKYGSNVRISPCDLCGESVLGSKMVEHLESHHVKDYITPCSYSRCPRVFSCRGKMERHLNSHYNSPRRVVVGTFPVNVKCETCQEEISRFTFRTHLQTHESEVAEKSLPCPIPGCPERYGLRQSVDDHLFTHDLRKTPEEQMCPACKKLFNIDLIEKHFKETHHIDSVIRCKRCPFIFPNWESLLDHLFEHRVNTLGGLPCDICDYSRLKFVTYNSLRQHFFNVHQIGNKFICEHCDREFFSERTLSRHKNTAHSRPASKQDDNDNNGAAKEKSGKRHKCDQCPDVAFSSSAGLRNHQVKTHGAPPPTCKFCQKICPTPHSLRRHEATHLGLGMSYKCSVESCGKVFDKITDWKKHQLVGHNPNAKLFICDTCGKGYNYRKHLKEHVDRVHLGKRKELPGPFVRFVEKAFPGQRLSGFTN